MRFAVDVNINQSLGSQLVSPAVLFLEKRAVMSVFISKALRRAEVFLEQVDESVAQASRQLVVDQTTGAVDDSEDLPSSDDEASKRSRASAIPRAEERAPQRVNESLTEVDNDAVEGDELPEDGDGGDAWGVDVEFEEAQAPGDGEQSEIASMAVAAEVGVEKESKDLKPDRPVHVSRENDALSPPQEANASAPAPVASFEPIPVGESAMLSVMDPMEAAAAMVVRDPSENQAPVHPKPARRFAPTLSKNASQKSLHNAGENNEYVQALKAESTELRKELELVETEFEKSRRERSKLVKNLKRMREIVSEMDESLRDKSAEARGLEAELVSAKDEISALRTKSRENDARGKDGMDLLRKELNSEIDKLQKNLATVSEEAEGLQEENERLKEALLHGHEVDQATADGARQDATQAHRAYEAEAQAHRETRKQTKDREEALEAEAALAAKALGTVQRKAEECSVAASNAKSAQRAAEAKLGTVTAARDAAFNRIEDLQDALRLYEKGEGNEAPGQKEAKLMVQTVSELENALEAKNVELNRLEGELESLRISVKARRDIGSPRTPGQPGRSENGTHQEVEVKLRHMADAALRKQAQLEVLRSENRALQHQLSTERKRTREAQAMAAAASSSRQTIRGGFQGILDAGDEERGDRMYGARDGPLARFRTPRNWPRSVSKVITGMDRFSAQALALLRKEPLLRIVILIYLVAMHIFVYSLLHWHVDSVTGSVDAPHESVATAKTGGRMRTLT